MFGAQFNLTVQRAKYVRAEGVGKKCFILSQACLTGWIGAMEIKRLDEKGNMKPNKKK